MADYIFWHWVALKMIIEESKRYKDKIEKIDRIRYFIGVILYILINIKKKKINFSFDFLLF